jgi:hypothetical protein
MLHAATAADAEVRTCRCHTLARCPDDAHHLCLLVGQLPAIAGILDALARQRALDEDRLAIDAGDTAAFVVQRLDQGFGHGGNCNGEKGAGL